MIHTPTFVGVVISNVLETVVTSTIGIIACPVAAKLCVMVMCPTAMHEEEIGPRTIQSITNFPQSIAAVPAGLVKDTLATSEVVPVVPKAISIVLVAVPAAVFVASKVQRN